MIGMDATTGKPLAGIAHLRQSVADILRTPLSSRVMLRDYGSDLFSLIDHPLTSETRMEIYSATVQALQDWEPRIQVDSVDVALEEPGHFDLTLYCTYLPSGEKIVLEGIAI